MTSKPAQSRLKLYYQLTKPGIIYGNLLSAIGGFLFAAQGSMNYVTFTSMTIGTASIIASACVYNNYFDRTIDRRMQRTIGRALASGQISTRHALVFGSILGILGVGTLAYGTNAPTLALGIIGWLTYVGVYTYAKRKTVHATLLGSIPGATPIAAGYTAFTGNFDLTALLLIFVMVIWQMPHFYAIAMFRRNDYKEAGVPVLSVVHGLRSSAQHILVYVVLFELSILALWYWSSAGYGLLVIMTVLGCYWFGRGLRGWRGLVTEHDYMGWARGMFGQSLYVLLALCITLSLDNWLP